MLEHICLKCTVVSIGAQPKCCGETALFDPAIHGRLLVSGNNGWVRIKEAWDSDFRENELTQKVSEKLADDGCFSAVIHMIYGIRELVKFYEDAEKS